jgi:bisphosphoglycerate-independent phosphoglycerate mutase (AlkP superfamily)
MAMQVKNKVCLMYVLTRRTLKILILSLNRVHDGWGIAAKEGLDGNAIEAADTTNMDTIAKNHSFRTLQASGTSVGLNEGLMGNSEVG